MYLKSAYIVLILLIFTTVNAAEDISTSSAELASLIIKMVDTNSGVLSAQAGVDAAAANERAKQQPLYNPELEVDIEEAESTAGSIGISQRIDWHDKRAAHNSIASQEVEVAAAQLHRTRQNLAIELLNAIVKYDIARQSVELAVERKRLMQESAALAGKRHEAGDLDLISLKLSRLALSEAQLKKANSSIALFDARQELFSILNEQEFTSIKLPEAPPYTAIADQSSELIVNNLPDTRVQLSRIASAREQVKLRQLETKPDPTVGVRLGQEESDLLAGINVSVPIFVRNNYGAEVDVANAELLEIELQAKDKYQRAYARLLTSIERYRLTEQTWRDWLATGALTVDEQQAALEQVWHAGEISTTEYLLQLDQMLDTQNAAVELRGRLWQAWVEWLAASGKVDDWLLTLRSQ